MVAERVESFYAEYKTISCADLISRRMPGHFRQLATPGATAAIEKLRPLVSPAPFVEGWAVYRRRA